MRVGPVLRVLVVAGLLASCAAEPDVVDDATPDAAGAAALAGYEQRLQLLDAAVTAWATAGTIDDARAAAETAANLVVGPGGPGFGDRDGDGTVLGATELGLLDGRGGEPTGVASALAGMGCVDRDVLDTTLADPDEAWDRMLAAIAAWTPSGNTMPTLPSHPMRVVGWATFTIGTDDLDTAHEFAGHARLHVDVAEDAPGCRP